MNCEEFNKLIDTYLDNDLNDEKSEEFEQHLSSCQQCCRELKSVNKCIDVMRKMYKEAEPPGSIRENVFKKCCGGKT